MNDELFDLVDESGRVIGSAPRSQCHGNPALIHQAVHVLVFDHAGRLFLQKRSAGKDVAPGLWDTSVGGHLRSGENPETGARREMVEELGREPGELVFAYQYLWRSPIETEWIRAFATVHEGPFQLDPIEIAEGRFWDPDEIVRRVAEPIFTPQFQQEFPRMRQWWNSRHAT